LDYSLESGNPGDGKPQRFPWTPAFAGVTNPETVFDLHRTPGRER